MLSPGTQALAAKSATVKRLKSVETIGSTSALTSSQWGVCLPGPIIYLVLSELVKLVDRHTGQRGPVPAPASA